MTDTRKVPNIVDGVPVFQSGKPSECHGGKWITLCPEDDKDDRLWEFDILTGRIIQTGR